MKVGVLAEGYLCPRAKSCKDCELVEVDDLCGKCKNPCQVAGRHA